MRCGVSSIQSTRVHRTGCALHHYLPLVITVHQGDNLRVLAAVPSGAFDLIYIDPPFNTGRTRLRTRRDAAGDRTGFGGQRYSSTKLGSKRFADAFDDYPGFLEPRLLEAK